MCGRAFEITIQNESANAFQVLAGIRHESKDFRLPISKFDAGAYIVFKVEVGHAVLTEYEHANYVDGIVKIEYTR